MDFSTHPLERRARSFGIHGDEYRAAQRMTNELDDLFTSLTTMSPGDLATEETLRQAMAMLMSITQHFGSVGGWTSGCHARLYAEANRLLGPGQLEFNQPNLREP